MILNDTNEVKMHEKQSEIELFARNAFAWQMKAFEQTLDQLDQAA